MLLDVAEETVVVTVQPLVPDIAQRHIDRARVLRDTMLWANRAAADERRSAARVLARELRLSLRDVGIILGVSSQRAHQLVHDALDGGERRRPGHTSSRSTLSTTGEWTTSTSSSLTTLPRVSVPASCVQVPGCRARALAEEYDVFVGTVRRATDELRSRGLARTLAHTGTFIENPASALALGMTEHVVLEEETDGEAY